MATELKPQIKDGMSQSERYLLSLDTGYFNIDEKDTTDLLTLLVDLSGQLNYYNYSNKIEGDWKDFLLSDIDIQLALLSKLDSRSIAGQYKKLSDALIHAEDENQLAEGLVNIFQFLRHFALLLVEYHTRFQMAGHLHHMHHFEPDTESIKLILKKLHAYYKKALRLPGNISRLLPDQTCAEFHDDSSDEATENPFEAEGSIREKIILALSYFDKMFSELNVKYAGLLHTSRHYLKKQRLDGNVYDPHVALLISFLHLHGYLQKSLNQLMKKHLDYYYQDIVGIQRRKETADKVHLVLEPAVTSGTFWLHKGEQVVAGIKDCEDKLLYELEHSVQVSGARIKELKTLFVSNKSQVKTRQSGTDDVKELQVFTEDHPVPDPATFLRHKTSFTPWPLLGEEQSELPVYEKTMSASDIGLAVASPLLYAADGERFYSLKFIIRKDAFNRFEEHAGDLSKASGISREVLMLEMLNQSFIVHLTGSTGWIVIEDYAVSCSSHSDSDSFIEIRFTLNHTDEPVAVYNSSVHGYDLGIAWPLIRLVLNNSAFHHPYTFLSYFIIDRINLRVDVKEAKSCKLKNNLGDLYGGSPFQPFGPVPAIGSYLDIKNTNIFNRYTTGFCLRLNWFNLPKEKGGFATYYAGYNYPFTDESFKVQISAAADTNTRTTVEQQQVFHLFEKAGNGNEYLKTHTEITDVNFKRIRFENAPALSQEWSGTQACLTQGTVHLELTAPHEVFGHRLYPQVFTETVVNNSKRFTKNRPIPNQPFIPVIRSLSIDYTLEHSEHTNGTSRTDEEEILLIHLYPFGYDKFYTGKNSKSNYFVPPTDQESNLYIGLTGLVAEQELSLLFELSEKNFHHTVHEPEEIQWSHLINNNWIPIDKASILQDTTINFVNSGIVTIRIPDRIEKGNTILSPDLYWIRASLPQSSSVRSKVVALFAQTAVAVRVQEQGNFPDHSYILPPGSIKGFKAKVPKINEVWQFFPSFNGQPEESYHQYNIRVSERLRHKQRLLSTTDISQAVLDAFPQISMVKCYSAGNGSSMILPGVDVHIIVIPKEREDGGFSNQEPKVNLYDLYKIKKFITRSVSGFVKVEVGNPVYEKIMVVAHVQFKTSPANRQSNGYYLKLMNEDIKKYISAWLYDPKVDFQIGTGIYVSEILNYLQNREYIDYITAFSLVHFYNAWDKTDKSFHARVTDTSIDKPDIINGSFPGAILVSAEEHLLTVIGQPLPEEASKAGIGEFSIGSGLLVNQPLIAPDTEQDTALLRPDELYDFTFYND